MINIQVVPFYVPVNIEPVTSNDAKALAGIFILLNIFLLISLIHFGIKYYKQPVERSLSGGTFREKSFLRMLFGRIESPRFVIFSCIIFVDVLTLLFYLGSLIGELL